MDTRFQNIKVLIWDFDGTFYPQTPAIYKAMEEAQYQTIMRIKGLSHAEAKEAFWKIYPKQTTSGNAAVGIVCDIPTAKAAIENERHFDRLDYIPKDPKLSELFKKLKGFRHFLLGNGVIENLRKAALGVGIADGTFEEIVTSEVSGANKPDPAGFVYIMKKTGLPADQHLMIGDREVVDLAPAKKLGMKTCLVTWGEGYEELEKTGASVDVSIPTVYDLPELIL